MLSAVLGTRSVRRYANTNRVLRSISVVSHGQIGFMPRSGITMIGSFV
ncbi:hypothetical protein [Nocardioides sp. B-3]|nr:hypothetical protein [Nocardioides sp. B-3]UUZ60573.1 hypothetical protein LP418_06810 [Nocardioides sp. B-3]